MRRLTRAAGARACSSLPRAGVVIPTKRISSEKKVPIHDRLIACRDIQSVIDVMEHLKSPTIFDYRTLINMSFRNSKFELVDRYFPLMLERFPSGKERFISYQTLANACFSVFDQGLGYPTLIKYFKEAPIAYRIYLRNKVIPKLPQSRGTVKAMTSDEKDLVMKRVYLIEDCGFTRKYNVYFAALLVTTDTMASLETVSRYYDLLINIGTFNAARMFTTYIAVLKYCLDGHHKRLAQRVLVQLNSDGPVKKLVDSENSILRLVFEMLIKGSDFDQALLLLKLSKDIGMTPNSRVWEAMKLVARQSGDFELEMEYSEREEELNRVEMLERIERNRIRTARELKELASEK